MSSAMTEDAAADLGLSEDGMWLTFTGHLRPDGTGKVYARTPLGEYAFGDAQGLYEWSRDAEDRPVRIDHTGADRTHIHDGRLTTTTGRPEPEIRGREAARSRLRWN